VVAGCGFDVYAGVEWYVLKLAVVDRRWDGVEG
jgi:hypothetical protein